MTRPEPVDQQSDGVATPVAAPRATAAGPRPEQPEGNEAEERAATAIQASYRSHTLRRSMSGLVLRKQPDEAWYGAVDELLGRKQPSLKWRRVTQDASVVGRGASAGDNSLMLKKEHWLEATDRQHRYGSNLEPYHEAWTASSTTQPFFLWLDEGEGRDLELPAVPRAKLAAEKLHYLSTEERAAVAAEVGPGGLLRFVGSGDPVHTLTPDDAAAYEADPEAWKAGQQAAVALARGGGDANVSEAERKAAKKKRNSNKWIFVASADMTKFYIAAKKKGTFGHSSFLAGGAVGAAGQIAVDHGRIVKLAPLSGHYVPSISHYIAFLDRLTDLGVDLSQALLLNPFDGELPACRHDLQCARLDALDDKER